MIGHHYTKIPNTLKTENVDNSNEHNPCGILFLLWFSLRRVQEAN